MAIKEKSNYTEEHLKFKKQRKYNKPGRPKKISHGKEQAKQTQSKASDARQEPEASFPDIDNNASEVNMSLENSRNSIAVEGSTNETTVDESQNFSSEFDGMPKLSPMTRSSDVQTKLGSSLGSPLSDEIPLAEIEKPFLKPATGRPKRERGRPRGSQAARKIAKVDSFEGNVNYKMHMSFYFGYHYNRILIADGSPSVAEAGKHNDYPEGKSNLNYSYCY